ncbi:hypothetical protein [Foetidibacter luteolus]|uniref:hypothetical protein n=1 Tax=Foetidibacter luteolus TaxID=2608880 RepID=UPI00129AA4EC|nr:hypothetical protein [Foetidibacter luteolus]
MLDTENGNPALLNNSIKFQMQLVYRIGNALQAAGDSSACFTRRGLSKFRFIEK